MSLHPPGSKQPAPHLLVTSGLLMGGADAIPGVSGGTIALILGIYERFIDALGAVVRLPLLMRSQEGRTEVKNALLFLIPLGVGVVISYYIVTKLLVGKKESPGFMLRPDTAPICYAFFFGLVLVSIREPWRRISSIATPHVIAALLGTAAAVVFVGLPHTTGDSSTVWLLLGGAGAISVMLLPGVSGSLFLVIIGQYQIVTTAVHMRELGTVLIFLVGIALGVITFVPLLRRLLHHQHDITMAALTGLMTGSLRVLWPWKDNYNPKSGPMINQGIGDDIVWVLVAFALGGAVVWLLAQLERRLEDNAP